MPVRYLLPELTPVADREWIVISGASDESAGFLNGMYSFSYQFWSAVFGGIILMMPFIMPKIYDEVFEFTMDANGNGIPNELSGK